MAMTLLTKFRAQLLPYKDEAYLKDFRKKYCQSEGGEPIDPHHIMGSTFGMKFTDYLLVPAPRSMHNKWQKDLPKYFSLFLPAAVERLISYAKERDLLVIKGEEIKFRVNYGDPLILNELIDRIYKNKERHYELSKPEEGKGSGKENLSL